MSETADSNNNPADQPQKLFPNGVPPETAPEIAEAFANLTVDDLIRGSTPPEIGSRCLALVRAYLSGTWATLTSADDLLVRRISGGMTNQLYHVTLRESIPRVPNPLYPSEPTSVAIKLYQEKHMKNYADGEDERLNDTIVLTLLSQLGLGPQVYGIFSDGVILAYVPHEQFRVKHQQSPVLLKQLAALLARVHHLSVPIRKNNHWLLTEMKSMLEQGFKAQPKFSEFTQELALEHFQTRDLTVEFEEFTQIINKLNAPLVFCHNDFRGSNILVTESNQILLCDLEYSSYGARGYDLGVFLSEWGRELFEFDKLELPADQAIERFVQLYLDACDALVPGYGAQPENSLQAVVAEVKIYILANFMFFVVFMFKQTESMIPSLPFDPKTQLTYVNKYYGYYLAAKNQLIETGIIKL